MKAEETPSVDTIMAKQLKEFSEKEDRSKVKDTYNAGPQVSQVSQMTDTSKVTLFSSSVTDASSTLTGLTSTTERSNDMTSEVESGAEDSEKQTTSDTDGEKYTGGATDSGDADTQEEGKGEITNHKASLCIVSYNIDCVKMYCFACCPQFVWFIKFCRSVTHSKPAEGNPAKVQG